MEGFVTHTPTPNPPYTHLHNTTHSNDQADYTAAWQRLVEGFTTLADACGGLKVSVEWKPTDPAARHSFLPSTGAALLLAQQVRVAASPRLLPA